MCFRCVMTFRSLRFPAAVVAILVLAGAVAWLGRYQIAAGRAGVYVADRWTGTVEWCVGAGACVDVYPSRYRVPSR